MQLRHTFVLAAGTAAALAIGGGAAFAAGSDDPRPHTPGVTSPSSTVRPSATPTARTADDQHRGRGTDDPAGDDRGGARAATSPAVIRGSATARTITPTRHAADDHGGTRKKSTTTAATRHSSDDKGGRRAGSDDRAGDDHGRHSGSDDRGGDDHGRHSGRD